MGAAFTPFGVDAVIAPFERREAAEIIALSRSDELLRRLTEPADFAHIRDPDVVPPMGDANGREPIEPADIPRSRLAVIIVAGQSNSANTAAADADGRYFEAPHLPIFNFHIGDGRIYRARNPLLGTSDDGGWQSFALPLAAMLIEAGLYDAALLATIGVGRTWVQEWVPEAHHFHRFERAAAGITALGFAPDLVLWHQGESNAGILYEERDCTGAPLTVVVRAAARLAYLRSLLRMVAGLRDLGIGGPVFVARATICGQGRPEPGIRQAQQDAAGASAVTGIFRGPDTDALPLSGRFDGCHFSHEGNIVHAQAWFEILRAYLIGAP
jgi:hypothetical protein